jgi:hypothetical protein
MARITQSNRNVRRLNRSQRRGRRGGGAVTSALAAFTVALREQDCSRLRAVTD